MLSFRYTATLAVAGNKKAKQQGTAVLLLAVPFSRHWGKISILSQVHCDKSHCF